VWPLVYAGKNKAVNELLNTENEDGTPRYIQGVDYQALDQMVQAGPGLSKKTIYKLSIPCMEWFIARKVRPVFEVYRQVFHRATEQKPLSQIDLIVQSALALKEQEQRISNVESEVRMLKANTNTHPNYFTIVGYATLNGISVNLRQASSLGRKAAILCRERGFQTDTTPDPRFGEVKMYPASVLDDVFELTIN
jgi:hypothetical protein